MRSNGQALLQVEAERLGPIVRSRQVELRADSEGGPAFPGLLFAGVPPLSSWADLHNLRTCQEGAACTAMAPRAASTAPDVRLTGQRLGVTSCEVLRRRSVCGARHTEYYEALVQRAVPHFLAAEQLTWRA